MWYLSSSNIIHPSIHPCMNAQTPISLFPLLLLLYDDACSSMAGQAVGAPRWTRSIRRCLTIPPIYLPTYHLSTHLPTYHLSTHLPTYHLSTSICLPIHQLIYLPTIPTHATIYPSISSTYPSTYLPIYLPIPLLSIYSAIGMPSKRQLHDLQLSSAYESYGPGDTSISIYLLFSLSLCMMMMVMMVMVMMVLLLLQVGSLCSPPRPHLSAVRGAPSAWITSSTLQVGCEWSPSYRCH